jgi:hypothetical protein
LNARPYITHLNEDRRFGASVTVVPQVALGATVQF